MSSGKPGSFHKFDASGIYINTLDKVIVITDLQFPNKNIISSKDALILIKISLFKKIHISLLILQKEV